MSVAPDDRVAPDDGVAPHGLGEFRVRITPNNRVGLSLDIWVRESAIAPDNRVSTNRSRVAVRIAPDDGVAPDNRVAPNDRIALEC